MTRDLASLNSYIRTENGVDLRAIPLVSFMDMLFYNIELLKDAGFDRPPKTRDEFLAFAKAVSQAGISGAGPYGAALGLSPGDPQALRRDVFSWIWAAGGEPGSLEQDTAPVFGSRIAADILVFLAQLNKDESLAPGSFEKTGAERLDEFAAGKIALIIASVKDIPLLRKKMGDTAFGATAIPGPALPGKTGLALSSIYAGISAASVHPDESWNFLLFLAEKSPAFSAKFKAVPGSFPGIFPDPNNTAAAEDYISNDPLYSKARDIFESAELVQGYAGQFHNEEFERRAREELRPFLRQSR
jgi:multiple sugar transport system substrate-binding protein